jgi:ribose-phosphate pyrophosphokinase
MRPNNGAIKLVAGNSNPALADAIAAYLATPLTKAVVRRFADMEIFVEIQENVRAMPARTANRDHARRSRPSWCRT